MKFHTQGFEQASVIQNQAVFTRLTSKAYNMFQQIDFTNAPHTHNPSSTASLKCVRTPQTDNVAYDVQFSLLILSLPCGVCGVDERLLITEMYILRCARACARACRRTPVYVPLHHRIPAHQLNIPVTQYDDSN